MNIINFFSQTLSYLFCSCCFKFISMKTRRRASVENSSRDDMSLADQYINNCKMFDLQVDPSVVIALKSEWNLLQPTKNFSEGSMLPLMGVLDSSDHITKVNLSNVGMYDSRIRAAGNGNSNARALSGILQNNKSIKELNLSNTGLDDDGLAEICDGIKINETLTELNLSGNHFGELGAASLTEALTMNKSIKKLDLSGNALGFRSIDSLLCACAPRQLAILTAGNFVFEEILNAVSHGIGFIFSVVGANILISEAAAVYHTDYHFWACVLYSFALMFLFLSSCLFHSFFMLPAPSRIFQILDHVGIYMVIAGSFTPFMLISLHHYIAARVLCTALWIAAVGGSVFAACNDLNAPATTMVELTIFLCMGFSVLLVSHLLFVELCASAMILATLGCVFYLVGIFFYIMGEYKPIYHVIWHVFVLAAATVHWFAVYFFVVQTDIMFSPAKTVVNDLLDAATATFNAAMNNTNN